MQRENMTREEAIELLISTGDIISMKGKYTLTGQFHRDFVPVPKTGLVVSNQLATNSSQAIVTQQDKILSVKELLKKFREDAEIPFRISNDGGKPFTANAIGIDGIKAFEKILKEGIDYQVLVYATKLYYKSDSFRKGLTNYLVQGDWEVAYLEFKKKLDDGNIDGYIKGELGGDFGDDI